MRGLLCAELEVPEGLLHQRLDILHLPAVLECVEKQGGEGLGPEGEGTCVLCINVYASNLMQLPGTVQLPLLSIAMTWQAGSLTSSRIQSTWPRGDTGED